MKFQLFGETVVIEPDRENYNRYRLMFQGKADEATRKFQGLYQTNTSLEMVVQNVPNQMQQCIRPVVKHCVQILIDHGILTVDEERFIDTYTDVLEPAYEAYSKIQDQYAEIVLSESEKDAYRTARREGRGRWQGGGFGLGGALKGAATAGALNMVTGAGHMLFNGVAKIGSSIAANSKMNQIFRSKDTAAMLESGLYQSVFRLHLALIHCLDQAGVEGQAIGGIVLPEASETASAMLRNIPQIKDTDQQCAAMIQAFQLDPYQEDWYRLALKIFGDHDGTLEEVERYFGITVICGEKERQLNKFVQTLPLDTEAQAQSAIKKIAKEKKRLCYSGETEQTKAVLAAVERFDVEYRTVEGTIFSTRQEAEASRLELPVIHDIEQDINYDDLASIADGEQKMAELSSPLAISRQKALHQKWTDLDLELRTVSTLLPDGKTIRCKTREQAEQLRATMQELKQRLDDCGEDVPAEQALLQFKSELSTMNIPSAAKKCYTEEIDKRLADIDLNLRTALGKEYPSREAAKEAQWLYKQIQSDFVTGNPRKNGGKFRQRIEAAEFSEPIKKELLDKLFQFENKRELQAAKILGTVSSVVLLAVVIASYFFHLSGTPEFARKDVVIRGVSLMLTDVQTVNTLTFFDGLKNGLMVFGRCIGDIFVNGFFDYTGGFQYGLIGNILWAVLGLFWVAIKHFFLGVARYLVSLVVTLIQAAPIRYYIGYVIGSAIPLAVSQLAFDEDKQEENVQRIKRWTVREICLVALVVIVVLAVTVYFAQQEL